ncbi:MAG TPA: DUF6541 family protein [Gaiellaceae bacterium]|nr:DUF6541 family protein [Gaiellaceae bacterium]
MSAAWLLLRLAVATGVVLLPGFLVARALGLRGLSAALAWTLALLFGALVVVFAAGTGISLALALLLACGAAALPFARAWRREQVPGWRLAALAGALLGVLLWHVAGEIGGDGLFHLARVRKLADLGALSLHRVDEFPDGGLHPGYAFPLWHGLLALVARLAGTDPAGVVLHEATVLAPLSVLAWYEAGWALFRRAWAAGATAGAAVALVAMAPGHGGAFTALALPATAARQLLVPAALALALETVRRPGRARAATTAAAGLALAVVHPTYALFLLLPFAGFLVVRWSWARADVRSGIAAVAALALPAAAFGAWLLPLVRETASVGPGAAERARALRQYASQLVVSSPDSFHLAPQVLARSGAVAVAALALVPLAGLAARRRWAAYVVGGSLAVLAVVLAAAPFVPFSDLVSLSQARRYAGFVPFAFAFAGGMGVAARLLGPLSVPAALAAGIVLQRAYAGDFGYVLRGDSPAWPAWTALAGGAVAGLAGLALGRRPPVAGAAGLAAAAFLLPVYVHGLAGWSPSAARPASPLTRGLVRALRERVPEGATVYADPETSYRIAAVAPVYVCVAPPGHVADTKANRPYARVDAFRRFARTGDLSVPRACGADWLVVDRTRFRPPPLTSAWRRYADERYGLYWLPPSR